MHTVLPLLIMFTSHYQHPAITFCLCPCVTPHSYLKVLMQTLQQSRVYCIACMIIAYVSPWITATRVGKLLWNNATEETTRNKTHTHIKFIILCICLTVWRAPLSPPCSNPKLSCYLAFNRCLFRHGKRLLTYPRAQSSVRQQKKVVSVHFQNKSLNQLESLTSQWVFKVSFWWAIWIDKRFIWQFGEVNYIFCFVVKASDIYSIYSIYMLYIVYTVIVIIG